MTTPEAESLPTDPRTHRQPITPAQQGRRDRLGNASRPNSRKAKAPKSAGAHDRETLFKMQAAARAARASNAPGSRYLFKPSSPDEHRFWAELLQPVQGRINVAMGHNYGDIDGSRIAAFLLPALNRTAPIVVGSCGAARATAVSRLLGFGEMQQIADRTRVAVLAFNGLVTPKAVADMVAWLNENHVDAMGQPHRATLFSTGDMLPAGWSWTYPLPR
jgi:hypothetical protein